jgi:hypothetical protein
MRGVPDATRDLQVFWDDLIYQLVFGIYLIWFLDLLSNAARIGKPLLFWLIVDYAPRIGCAFSLTLDTLNATYTLARHGD